jgi:hypothetical protein
MQDQYLIAGLIIFGLGYWRGYIRGAGRTRRVIKDFFK